MAIVNGQGRVGIRVTSGASSSPYLLNNYSGSSAAFSLRRLSSTSTYAIRVRRSSDNTEQNIGFDGSGNLDTTALTTFVGAGNGYVTIWYDQSGLGRDAIQTTASNQPKIVSSGSINMLNGKPSIRFDQSLNNYLYVNSSSVLNIQDCISTFTVSNFVGNGGFYGHLMSKGYGSEGSYSFGLYGNTLVTGNKLQIWTESEAIVFTPTLNINQQHIYSNTNAVGSNGIKLYVDNSLFSERTTTNDLNGTNSYLFTIGRNNRENSYYLDGNIQEMVCYPTYQQSNLSNINSNLNTYYSVYTTLDSDAAAFISAASITDSTQISAVNTLVTSLKSAGVWNKFFVIRPFVGGTSLAHGLNLKDTSKYTMTFASGISHDSNGINGNGTGYGANNFPYTGANKDSFSVGHYVKSGNSIFYFGATAGSRIEIYNEPNVLYWAVNSGVETLKTGQTTKSGLYVVDRNSANSKKLYRNGSELHSDTDVSTSFPATDIYVLGRSTYTGIQNASVGICSFFFIASSFTSSEQTAVYNAVQAFQTTLGRQV